jgi:hypothetical protein
MFCNYRYYPELAKLRTLKEEAEGVCNKLAKCMRNDIAKAICEFEDVCGRGVCNQARDIQNSKEVLFNISINMIRYIIETRARLKELTSCVDTPLKAVQQLAWDRARLIGTMLHATPPLEEQSRFLTDMASKHKMMPLVKRIHERFGKLLKSDNFQIDNVCGLTKNMLALQIEYDCLEMRYTEHFLNSARLQMSTIGSSHKIPVAFGMRTADEVKIDTTMQSNGSDAEETLIKDEDSEASEECTENEAVAESHNRGEENIDDQIEDDRKSCPGFNLSGPQGGVTGRETIVVLDEAGCIPDFELLGLSRISDNIVCIVAVGDKHQLPPYDPCRGRLSKSKRQGNQSDGQKSVLDWSGLDKPSQKVKIALTSQYRVPRDIASILNECVYSGGYNTPPKCPVPTKGLVLRHVAANNHSRKKYVNMNEVGHIVKILIKAMHSRVGLSGGALVLTPVSFEHIKMNSSGYALGRTSYAPLYVYVNPV